MWQAGWDGTEQVELWLPGNEKENPEAEGLSSFLPYIPPYVMAPPTCLLTSVVNLTQFGINKRQAPGHTPERFSWPGRLFEVGIATPNVDNSFQWKHRWKEAPEQKLCFLSSWHHSYGASSPSAAIIAAAALLSW